MNTPRLVRSVAALAAALLVLAAAPAAAQESSPPLVKYGKWAMLAGSLGMNLLAAQAHDRADDAYGTLRDRCDTTEALCIRGEDGAYLNGDTEAIYQESLRHDRQARRWLVAGQGALVGAAALFIWEFARPKGLPENIPFDPEVEVTARETRIGARVAF